MKTWPCEHIEKRDKQWWKKSTLNQHGHWVCGSTIYCDQCAAKRPDELCFCKTAKPGEAVSVSFAPGMAHKAVCIKCDEPFPPTEPKKVKLWEKLLIVMEEDMDATQGEDAEKCAKIAIKHVKEIVDEEPNCDCGKIRCQEGCVNKHNLKCRLDEGVE